MKCLNAYYERDESPSALPRHHNFILTDEDGQYCCNAGRRHSNYWTDAEYELMTRFDKEVRELFDGEWTYENKPTKAHIYCAVQNLSTSLIGPIHRLVTDELWGKEAESNV